LIFQVTADRVDPRLDREQIKRQIVRPVTAEQEPIKVAAAVRLATGDFAVRQRLAWPDVERDFLPEQIWMAGSTTAMTCSTGQRVASRSGNCNHTAAGRR
jgi:hypothetical protein